MAPILIVCSLVLAGFFIYTASKREISSLENVFFQIFILATSLSGSYLLGKKISEASAFEAIKPYARSAFRRVLSLYYGLSRLAKDVGHEIRIKNNNSLLEKFQATIEEQLYTADDALEDWRDIVPEDVEEIQQRVKEKIEQRIKEKNLIKKGISNDNQ